MALTDRPTRAELLNAADVAETHLSEMIGRWTDHIPAEVRAELHGVRAPLEALLIRARRRGQPRVGE
jgi:hypothetical protein